MAVIQFENGIKVNFNGTPTQQDVEEVANHLNSQGKPQSFGQRLGAATKATLTQDLPNFVTAPFKGFAEPFQKVAGTTVRAFQSIPATVKEAQGVFTHNQPLANQGATEANAIQKAPIFGQQTLPGSTPLQNLGTAAQIASYIPGGQILKEANPTELFCSFAKSFCLS